jgi:hypothetical protein
LRIDGALVVSEEIAIPARETRSHAFAHPLKPGTHQVAVDDLPPATVVASGPVRAPYTSYANTEAAFHQVEGGFYVSAGG